MDSIMPKVLDKLPIPSIWKLNKSPTYIGNPRTLRLCYLFVAICALLTFIGTIIYYFVYQRQITTTIGFKSDLGDEWKCASLGTYNGDFSLLSRSNVPVWNLSKSVNAGFIELFDEETVSMSINDGSSSYWIQPLRPIVYSTDHQYLNGQTLETRSSYAVLSGNARTIEDCVSEYSNYACSNINTSDIWTDVKLYKFTLKSVDITGGSSFSYASNLRLYNYPPSSNYEVDDGVFFESYYYTNALSSAFSNDSAYIYTMSENSNIDICSIVQSGVDNGVFLWVSTLHFDSSYSCSYPYSDYSSECSGVSVTYDITCEEISNDYCGINTTDAFTVTNTDKFESGMTMIHNDGGGDWNHFTTIMMLGPELGDSCAQRWEGICEEYFDIEGLCERMFVSPFKCTKEDRKELWTILSLSFASSQLVLAILSVIIAFIFKRCGEPVTEENNDKKIHVLQHSDKVGMETEIEATSINNNNDKEREI